MTTAKTRPALNGVDTPTLFATLDAVRANPELAKFQFRATNRWISGTNNQKQDPRLLRRRAGGHQPYQRLRLRRRPPSRARGHRQGHRRRWSSCCTRSRPA